MRLFHSFGVERAKGSAGAVASLTGGTLRVYGWSTVTHNPDTAAATFLSDLNVSAIVVGPVTLTNVVYGSVGGQLFTLDHDNIDWGAAAGSDYNSLLYVLWSGSNATSRLVLIHDITPTRSQTITIDPLGIGRL